MDGGSVLVSVYDSLAQVAEAEWDACACPEIEDGGRAYDPFTTHRFLKALEDSRSVGAGTGWQAQYLVAEMDEQVIACAPLYAKSHSQGEYIFDHNWAHAYERAGGRYFPKLQMAVPFTPVTGRRMLTRPGYRQAGQDALMQAAVSLADRNQLSSLHVTFCTADEREVGTQMGLLPRITQQFHWMNDGYKTFDDFLSSLSSRKRKNLRKERARAQGFGGEIVQLSGEALRPEHWEAFWAFYQDTGARKWGMPYLTRRFFDIAQERLRDDILLVLALEDGVPVAGAMNVVGRDALYGRYWGCCAHHPAMHFELCYYQAIDYAIEHGLSRVEAGAQGEHKLARGYLPVETHSLHWFRDPPFADAVARYLDAEREAVAEDIEILTAFGPFKKPNVEEQE
ncbi:MAG: GNAT family N-acetyltransferase [Pseudomonadota bacterium]